MPFVSTIRSIFNVSLTVDETTATETLGAWGVDPSTGNVYRYVKNASSSALAKGDWCCYDMPDARNAADVVVPATANLDRLAGLVYNGITNAKHGWIQCTGFADFANVDGTTNITAKDSIKASNGLVSLVQDAAAGTEPTYASRAYALEAVSTDGKNANIDVKICCLACL